MTTAVKRYRVAHFGTGITGSIALRQIIARPGLELVGHLVHSANKVGRDAGEIVGVAATGIIASNDFDAFLALDADCVSYFATDYGREPDAVIDQMCAILAAGKNIVTTSMTPLVYPKGVPGDVAARLERACAQGGSSFFASGIVPGFTPDVMVLAGASLSDKIDTITMSERVPAGHYVDPITYQMLGFGQKPENDPTGDPNVLGSTFLSSMRMIADGLGVELDEIRGEKKIALANRDYEVPLGKIAKGTISTVVFHSEGIVAGRPRIFLSMIYPMVDDQDDPFEPRFPEGARWQRLSRLDIVGTPNLRLELSLDSGAPLPGTHCTASRAINAIPQVCDAAPGALDAFTVPFASRGAMQVD